MALEDDLTAALDRGDTDGAATLVIEALGPGALGYLRPILRSQEEVEDVFSTFAENVWKGLRTWRREGNLKAWAYRVAWNAATRLHRDPYRRLRERLPSTMASRLALSMAASTPQTQERESSQLAALRATLTPEEQSLLTLRVDRDLS
jgi:RNA polymerase sigma-70 factor (ECF subfamily)